MQQHYHHWLLTKAFIFQWKTMSESPPPPYNLEDAVMNPAMEISTTPPTPQGGGVRVLIPQQFPGAFYYPPCKCDLVNQVPSILKASKK